MIIHQPVNDITRDGWEIQGQRLYDAIHIRRDGSGPHSISASDSFWGNWHVRHVIKPTFFFFGDGDMKE